MGKRLAVVIGLAAAGVIALATQTAVAAPIECGVPITATVKSLTQDLTCGGDGIVAGTSPQRIYLNGHTISGFGSTGVGIDFAGQSNVFISGANAVVEDFKTGMVMDSRQGRVTNLTVAFPTAIGIAVPPSPGGVNAVATNVTVSNAGTDGVWIAADDRNPTPSALFSSVKVFSSATNGISIDGRTKTTVESSVSKQNGADGIVVSPTGGSVGSKVTIRDSRANYNVGWGINGLRRVRSSNNRAVGNGQVRQCRIVECN